MAENSTNKERLKEITASIEAGIQDLFQSERYMAYLRTMSRFHRYSVNNVMLIHMQKPDATLVAGFNKWRDQFGRNVMRGEKGIKIIAPTPFKKRIEEEKLDPDTKLPMRDKDGNIIMEEKEVKIPMFKVVTVFDVSQTDGKPLPELASDLTGDVQNYEVFMEALRRSSPVPIEMKPISPDTDGFFSLDKQSITIREGMSEVQTVSAVIHEITHSKLHNYEQKRLAEQDAAQPKDRNTEEVEAESVSFAVCAYYGIQTGENSFGYIANWSRNRELPELRASLETINKTASELIDDIDRHYADICKEQGLLQKAEEIENEPAFAMERLYTVDDSKYLHVQRCDDGFDYTIYDMATKKALDGGQLDLQAEQLSVAALEICKLHNIGGDAPIRLADIGILDGLQEAETELPSLPELVQDYPMPDPAITFEDMFSYGYTDGNTMLPLSKDRARELYEQDVPVFMLYGDSTESMALDAEDIEKHDGIFGIEREEWDNTRGTLADRPVQTVPYPQAEQRREAENYLKNAEIATEDDYGMIDGIINNGTKQPTVSELEEQAKSGQPISLMDLADAIHRENAEKKPSVLAQLKSAEQQTEKTHKTALKRSAEREL